MALPENIRLIRKIIGLTQAQLAERIGVARTTVTQWENGTSNPPIKTIQRLAQTLGVPVTIVVGDNDANDLKRALDKIRAPCARLRRRIHPGIANKPDMLDECIELPSEVALAHPNAYFLEVKGDCMNRVYPEGCLILIDPESEPRSGSIAVVSIDGSECLVRRLYQTAHTLVLSPESWNSEHCDVIIERGDSRNVSIHGIVVWFQSRTQMS
ncbi:transcriptional regulator, XRE family [Coriobacterium glomerans PW2]|uniref:Transcriptional regulator, XRE family n=1 Tax=Coriobacterium glomerans (strain ATCC 49209 / DSM 20642 / JCM 10262 / PW2) TaxID=700015 RepID=F2N719_CORGP|nr:XRE family transcriptional regulator [Coriobacterium glomerans]AEB06358.1 transcriptional regulator, XRE family [Coriobacterium glomerans PW2]